MSDTDLFLGLFCIALCVGQIGMVYFCYRCLSQVKEVHSNILELASIIHARTTRKPGRPRSGVVQRDKEVQ